MAANSLALGRLLIAAICASVILSRGFFVVPVAS
jgi:hypothetical protein